MKLAEHQFGMCSGGSPCPCVDLSYSTFLFRCPSQEIHSGSLHLGIKQKYISHQGLHEGASGTAPLSEQRAARAAARQPRAPPGRASPPPATGKARGSARARRERPAADTQPTRVPRSAEASSKRSISPIVTIHSVQYGSETAARSCGAPSYQGRRQRSLLPARSRCGTWGGPAVPRGVWARTAPRAPHGRLAAGQLPDSTLTESKAGAARRGSRGHRCGNSRELILRLHNAEAASQTDR